MTKKSYLISAKRTFGVDNFDNLELCGLQLGKFGHYHDIRVGGGVGGSPTTCLLLKQTIQGTVKSLIFQTLFEKTSNSVSCSRPPE